ncbi:MAG: penicillin-binding protein 1A [Alphaproteobacteria bacterium]|nr:penicillin-binding protein 1A [Alphaproteobacteria bacterium]
MIKLLKILFVLVLFGGIVGVGVVGLAVWYFGRDLPDYQQLANYQPPVVTRVYAGDGRLLAEYATEKRVFVPVGAMPPLVIHAFLAAEDRNFYSHPGVDPLSMARAAITDLFRLAEHRRPAGASTITQQVAKNFLLNNELSLKRKIREALIAIRMEQAMSKDRILELYLNGIYLGGGTYGVAAAALNYFNKPLDQLSVQEAAFLAALPKAPNNYDPRRHPEAATERRDWVIDRMADAGFITPQQAQAAKAQPIELRQRDATEMAHADYFNEEVRRALIDRYGEREVYEGGLLVRTSLDPTLQTAADKALRGALEAYDRRHGWRGPVTRIASDGDWQSRLAAVPVPAGAADVGWSLAVVLSTAGDAATIGFANGSEAQIPYSELRWARKYINDDAVGPVPATAAAAVAAGDVVLVQKLDAAGKTYGLRQIPAASGALVAMDPHTGRVLAMSGGFSFAMSQFDRATQAKRQTGSAIKPFIYLAALDHGFTPSTLVLDAPFVVDQGPGLPKWNPTNYEHRFYGPVPLFFALQESLNLVTARVGTTVGLPIIQDYLVKRFGILDQMPLEDSYILGAGVTTPLRLTTAYAMLVNGGKQIHPTFIDRVQDRNGKTIYRADDRPCDGCNNVAWTGQAPPELPDMQAQIADPRSCYQIVSMLEGVVQRGTGRIVSSIGKPLAGKTGTTNESADTWFVGFSPDLAAGVYVGFDQPRSLGKHEVGATVAAPAFRDFMAAALKGKPAIPFRIPPGIELVRIDARTGRLPASGDRSVIWGAFKPGTEPTNEPSQVVSGNGITLGVGDFAPNGGAASDEAGNGAQPGPRSGTGGLY